MHDDLPSHGSTVGPWLILERLDFGSFGVVYRARRAGHPEAQPVVVKMARRPRDPRFVREAELLKLSIPGAPRFEDEGLWTAPSGERHPYVVMELVKGLTLSLDLEALILRLLAADREQRGTAEQLAREAMAFSNAAGEAADRSIDPIMSPELAAAIGGPSSDGADDELMSESESESDTDEPAASSSTDSTRRPRQPDPDLPSWLTAALAVTAAGLSLSLMLALLLLLARTSPGKEEMPWSATSEVPHFAPDAGMGEEALSSAHVPEKRVGPWVLSLGRPMPPKPYPDQRRPPCIPRLEVEINGGCWVGPIGNQKPPCGNEMFDYQGGCYAASFSGPKTPTSGEP